MALITGKAFGVERLSCSVNTPVVPMILSRRHAYDDIFTMESSPIGGFGGIVTEAPLP
jgi:hypothetical protein